MVVVALAFIILPAAGEAQSWGLAVNIGGGPSVKTVSLGGEPGHRLYITTLSVTHPLLHWKRFSASYFGEVLPLVVATRVEKLEQSWFYTNPERTDSTLFDFPVERPVVGVGALPVGLRFLVGLTGRTTLFVEGIGGGVAFTRAMPNPGARALNFLGSAGAGVRLRTRGQLGYTFGYRFTHISNANTALENPGFNAHIFYLGITLH